MKVPQNKKRKPKVYTSRFDSERVERGWYYPDRQVIRLKFPDNAMWEYENCTPKHWEALLKTRSPGRYLREVLDLHPYHSV